MVNENLQAKKYLVVGRLEWKLIVLENYLFCNKNLIMDIVFCWENVRPSYIKYAHPLTSNLQICFPFTFLFLSGEFCYKWAFQSLMDVNGKK